MTFEELIKNNSTLIIAIYGALVSTIAVGWSIYNSLQDKPKIRVSAKFGFMQSSKGLEEDIFLFIKIINKGKRSIHLSSFGLRSEKGDLIPSRITALPFELKGGTSHSEFFKMDELEKLEDKQFYFAWYRDETGRLYKSKSIRKKLNNYFNSKKKND